MARGRNMQKKLTITIDREVYFGLHKVIGPRKISKFVEELVRPHVIKHELESAYKNMAKDRAREKEALEWSEATSGDISNEKG
jgi:predicted CopG family antitoxin